MSIGVAHVIENVVEQLVQDAEKSGHRRALVLAGDEAWGRELAEQGIGHVNFSDVLWVSDKGPIGVDVVTAAKANKALGQEYEAVVFDGHCGVNVDALGAVSGTVRGGGLFIILLPALEALARFNDPEYQRLTVAGFDSAEVTGCFLRRFGRMIHQADGVAVVSQTVGIVELPPRVESADDRPMPADAVCRTQDQVQAVAAVMKVATGHRKRPVVLTSHRGRGKSAALGIAAANLIIQGKKHIIVTAPQLDAVESLFEHAQRLLPAAFKASGAIHFDDALIEFVAPDALIEAQHEPCLVLVDEAAAIPAAMLEKILRQYSRVAFATTVHGYEGTGRGFAVRFNKTLDELTPEWNAITLDAPIRWAANDPVEQFIFDALLLDASAAPEDTIAEATLGQCTIDIVGREQLEADDRLLSELFGLLVLAHYRTRPYDLRVLLDSPNVSVYLMRFKGHVVGAALVANEGGFDDELAAAIYEGKRRPQGHLVPQTLSVHLGLEQAAALTYARVMRIAIHPKVQNKGLGTGLLAELGRKVTQENIDCLSASFAATDEILRFWSRQYTPVRIGLTKEHTSGSHSVVLLYPLSDEGTRLCSIARQRFVASLPALLADPLRELDVELAAALLLGGSSNFAPVFNEYDWRDLVAFAYGRRGYELSMAPLWELALCALGDPNAEALIGKKDRNVLIAKVIQKQGWLEVASLLGLAGRTAVLDAMRYAIRPLVAYYGEDWVLQEAERFTKSLEG